MHVVSVNISTETGTIKHPVPELTIDEKGGVDDAHAGSWHRQVSLLAQESVDRFAEKMTRKIKPGEFAENITTQGIDLGTVSILDRFVIGDVELEVTQIGKECHGERCAIFLEVGKCVMPKEGIFCRVCSTGTIRPGDSITYLPRPLRLRVITLSDRAQRGEYEDLSGPRVREILTEFFRDKRWRIEIESQLVGDEAEQLRLELESARDAGVDVVITTGGTGVGPRDITPEVVLSVCDKVVPGVMEHIRLKYGGNKPNALLSRGIAGVMKQTLIYTLPGSVRAVNEYMEEILKTMEHLIRMIHGLGH
ncbi:molybdenum cofactor synthesis protein [candidate division WOR_3 bacterium SM1_77]|uniref:Molybdenum cofactor synthesis protein n=1 Tax=candidate division WOR_3 bacterium SM1_77 TaxID=1703778 RepID=A0A0S8K1E7_UNCW3|nr:MAG: molybdenum cofactor synthesis protein [candidate division WOR_3 bacterium SM1_77]